MIIYIFINLNLFQNINFIIKIFFQVEYSSIFFLAETYMSKI